MQQMLAGLREQVAQDIPFLIAERQNRLSTLAQLLDDPVLDQAKKLDHLLQAWQKEIAYGQTTETWVAKLDTPELDEQRKVTFVRIGRIGYYYLSLDRTFSAIWRQGWHSLPDDQTALLVQVVDILNSKKSPRVFKIPRLQGGAKW